MVSKANVRFRLSKNSGAYSNPVLSFKTMSELQKMMTRAAPLDEC